MFIYVLIRLLFSSKVGAGMVMRLAASANCYTGIRNVTPSVPNYKPLYLYV